MKKNKVFDFLVSVVFIFIFLNVIGVLGWLLLAIVREISKVNYFW